MIKAAVLWIVDENGDFLLAQRAHHKRQDPGVWGASATGKLEPGETFYDALLRETEEEIGLTLKQYSPTFLLEKDYDHPDGEQRRFGIYYTTLPRAITRKLKINNNEVAAVKWFTVDELFKKMEQSPKELVPSANAIWPLVFAGVNDAIFMRQAINLAQQAKQNGDYPFGAVIVKDNKVIATGRSEELSQKDVTKHAELQAVSRACKKLGTMKLNDCTLYASGEPCNMCASSAFQADTRRVVIGATRADLSHFFRKRKIGVMQLADDASQKIAVVTGVLNDEAIQLFDGVNKK